jgi:hypothetical protein
MRAPIALLLVTACGSSRSPSTPPAAEVETLSFAIREGATENRFYRRGPVAAHVLATSGEAPRLVVAFPAGNAGIGLWFGKPADLAIEGELAPVHGSGKRYGVEFTVRAAARELAVGKAILGGNWSLREWVPPGLTFPKLVNQVSPKGISRRTLDGKHTIVLELDPKGGATWDPKSMVLRAAPGESSIAVRMIATTDEVPLTPIATSELLLGPTAKADQDMLRALAFLSYREALVAGSWRFLGYFGRDTLLSVMMLMPAARPELIEAGLGSVIDRLSADGAVAHYEETGEFVTLRHLAQNDGADLREPYYEYKMVDDDFMLAPVVAAYFATPAGDKRAKAFLDRRTLAGEKYAVALRRNIDRVMKAAAPYAQKPEWQNLVAFDKDYKWGEWRDSDEGNGGGRISWNVNAVLVPAALGAAAVLLRHPDLGADSAAARRAETMEAVWRGKAPAHFVVRLDAKAAAERVTAYAVKLGIDPAPALAAIGDGVVIDAIALDRSGAPIPIQHSDDGFAMLFGEPPDDYLRRVAHRINAPFPAGLRTPVGVVVANPAYAPEALQATFTNAHYHGTVVWSWQQAMLAAGLQRQLSRNRLPRVVPQPPAQLGEHLRRDRIDPITLQALSTAEKALWGGIQAMRAQAAGELWSFQVQGGKITLLPFGQARGHKDESNAAQLWSTVYLAVRPPLDLR